MTRGEWEREAQHKLAMWQEVEAEFGRIPELCVLLTVNPRTGDFSICPTTLVVEGSDERRTVTWISNQGPFVIQFLERTPFNRAQFHSNKVRDSMHAAMVPLPRDFQAGIFEYAVAICTEGKAYLHVSGEMSMNPGGGNK